MAEDRELRHRSLEAVSHEVLLIDETLPEAGRALVTGEGEVGLETHLAGVAAVGNRERGGDLTGVVVRSGEADALEQDLEEDLSVKREGSLEDKC